MVTKSKKQARVKVGKLKLTKETVKNLPASEVKKIKGGAIPTVGLQQTGGYLTKKTQ
jgi:hypothetical protein